MKVRTKLKRSNLAALLFLLPAGVSSAAVPIFLENAELGNRLELLGQPNYLPSIGKADNLSIVHDNNDNVFVAYQDDAGLANVSQYESGTWSLISGGPVSSVNATMESLAIDSNNNLYLAYVEPENASTTTFTTVKKYNGTSWEDLPTPKMKGSSVSFFKMQVDSQGAPYLFYINNNKAGVLITYDGTEWVELGNAVRKAFATGAGVMMADFALASDDTPYIVYRDRDVSNQTIIQKLDNNSWVNVGVHKEVLSALDFSLAFSANDTPYIAAAGPNNSNGIAVYHFVDGAWVRVGNQGFNLIIDEATTKNTVDNLNLVIGENSVPYVSYRDSNNTPSTKRLIRMAKYDDSADINDDDVNDLAWHEVSYSIDESSHLPASIDTVNNDFIQSSVDSLNRVSVVYKDGGEVQDGNARVMRLAMEPLDELVKFALGGPVSEVGTLMPIDSDGDILTLALSGVDAALFDIEQSTGLITFKVVPDLIVTTVYNITVDASDATDTTSTRVEITVPAGADTTNPVITLTGDIEQIIELNSEYQELGATAIDDFNGDITGSINIDASAVDVNTVGDYSVVYSVSDSAGNPDTISRRVKVIDSAPVITLIGGASVNVGSGVAYVDLGATATDLVDGDITSNIVTDTSMVDTSVVAVYKVTYTVTDTAGSEATTEREVVVVDLPPTLSLNGDADVDIYQDDLYNELGAVASDAIDGDISAQIIIDSSTVDVTTIGRYEVMYFVEDSSGNSVNLTRTVNVLMKPTLPANKEGGSTGLLMFFLTSLGLLLRRKS